MFFGDLRRFLRMSAAATAGLTYSLAHAIETRHGSLPRTCWTQRWIDPTARGGSSQYRDRKISTELHPRPD